MATNVAAPLCLSVVVLDNLTCGNCGRAIAQYTDHRDPERPLVWQHRRGRVVGTTYELRQAAHEARMERNRAETRVAELLADKSELEGRLTVLGAGDTSALRRIEKKLDELLSRPAGIIEWRPDHRRHADGGERVDVQRKRDGVPRVVRVARD